MRILKNTSELFTKEVNDVIEEEKELIDNDSPKYGLALSGGGVRSAAFSLGVIQAFHKAGKFKLFDYLSTVSGGGYIGSSLIWWLYLSEKQSEKKDSQSDIFPFSDASERGKEWTKVFPGGQKHKFRNPLLQNNGHVRAMVGTSRT